MEQKSGMPGPLAVGQPQAGFIAGSHQALLPTRARLWQNTHPNMLDCTTCHTRGNTHPNMLDCSIWPATPAHRRALPYEVPSTANGGVLATSQHTEQVCGGVGWGWWGGRRALLQASTPGRRWVGMARGALQTGSAELLMMRTRVQAHDAQHTSDVTNAHIHTDTHTCTHMCTHAHALAYTHTHTHAAGSPARAAAARALPPGRPGSAGGLVWAGPCGGGHD